MSLSENHLSAITFLMTDSTASETTPLDSLSLSPVARTLARVSPHPQRSPPADSERPAGASRATDADSAPEAPSSQAGHAHAPSFQRQRTAKGLARVRPVVLKVLMWKWSGGGTQKAARDQCRSDHRADMKDTTKETMISVCACREVCNLFRHSSVIGQNRCLQREWMTAAASGQRERVVQQMPTALPRLARVSPMASLNKVFHGYHNWHCRKEGDATKSSTTTGIAEERGMANSH